MKWFIFIIILSLGLAVNKAEAMILRDLKFGDRGEDVRELQQKLNRAGILVAEVGLGSSGFETDFFGEATRRAVVRYQETHRDKILVPAGLAIGTGYVGFLTRLTLNSSSAPIVNINEVNLNTIPVVMAPPLVLTKETIPVNNILNSISENDTWVDESVIAKFIPATGTGLAGLALPDEPKRSTTLKLVSLNPSSGGPNTEVVIKGVFSKNYHTIYAGGHVIKNARSVDGSTIKITMISPYEFDSLSSEAREKIPIGTMPLGVYVEDDTGVSNGLVFNLNSK